MRLECFVHIHFATTTPPEQKTSSPHLTLDQSDRQLNIIMGGFGFKSRHKQSAPEPLKPKGHAKGSAKIDLQPSAEEPSSLLKKSRPKVPRSGGKSVASKLKQRALRQKEEAQETAPRKAKPLTKQNSQESDPDSDDDSNDEDDDGNQDEDQEDKGLEEARK